MIFALIQRFVIWVFIPKLVFSLRVVGMILTRDPEKIARWLQMFPKY